MLHLILGRAGTGKTHHIFQQIKQEGRHRPQILLVPEQMSHDAERMLCSSCGAQASAYGEVLSFTRLAHRVFSVGGGMAIPQLDQGGRLLLMSQAVANVSSQLKTYRRPSAKAAFLEQLLATSEELKSYCVPPEELIRTGKEEQGEKGERLTDLGLILSTYDALTAEGARDPRDQMTRLAEKLLETQWFRGKDVYLDGFTDFTPQQRLILERALVQSHSVTAVLCCDSLEREGENIFLPYRRTALSLMQMSKDSRVPFDYQVLTQQKGQRSPELIYMEQSLFSDGEPWDQPCEQIRFCQYNDPYEEVTKAAEEVLRLVHDQGWHFRDIAVAARTMERYETLIETIFRRYQIPIFLGRVEPILEKPILALLTAALDSIQSNFEYEDVFRYLKTGLAGLEWEEIDLLENYVVRWEIRGSRWTREEDWTWHPYGYALEWSEEDKALLKQLNQLRRRVITPLMELGQHKTAEGGQHAQQLYHFLEQIQLPQRLSQRAAQLQEQGELQQAEEYRQLWQILIQAMEQCSQILGQQQMELDYFTDLFRLMLSQYSVGSIPVSLDRVNGGEMTRLSRSRCKALILLGVDEDNFPLITQSPGLLTDEDREMLTLKGMELAPSADLRLDREQTMAYDILTRPTDLLILSMSNSVMGAGKNPAVLWERLRRLFPQIRREEAGTDSRLLAPIPAMEYAAGTNQKELLELLSRREGWKQRPEKIMKVREMSRGSLSPQLVRELYSDQIRLSASKMDKLKSCHFAYFLQYGLKARPRKRAGFDAPEAGTFVHYVLEQVLKAGKVKGGIRSLSEQERKHELEKAVMSFIQDQLGGLEDQTPRFRYLFQRLVRSAEVVLQNVIEELENSKFQPIDFELGFGRGEALPPVQLQVGDLTISISGFVDRVDGWVDKDRIYLRVVDYKTGKKSFSLTDVWNGLSLQMLLYLFTLESSSEDYYGMKAIPAGVLYLPAREVIVAGSRGMSPEARQKEIDRQLKRSGLLLRDQEVLRAMEDWSDKGPRFLPIRIKRGGAFYEDSLATSEQWGRLRKRMDRLLQQIGNEFSSGNVDADPYFKGDGHSACDFCDFADVCYFEEGQGRDCRRYLHNIKQDAFWTAVQGEEMEQ